ncbi:unnamed protein product [Darwinula stevensoni]|uniref:ABC transporter domain-containing protein n=1 Tax=Darwinula stevensoni TaxID=69355 RepID=A0A7R8X7Z7_9CRUS|nr:unnamed protein product [Darwinula stevensoni]CAG0889592.1 unnamed protein product [Darwinula stevensoni]
MAPSMSRLSPQTCAVAVSASVSSYWFLFTLHNIQRIRARNKEKGTFVIHEDAKKKSTAAVDGVFFRRVQKLLKVAVPGFFTRETGFLFLVAFILVLRSGCDLWLIRNGTLIESTIIGRDIPGFIRHIREYLISMPIIAMVNNLLKMGLDELKLLFRLRISKYLYDLYLTEFTYYKMANLDSRIANADQLLTEDVQKFSDSLVDLYSNLSKPVLDIFIYVYRLTSTLGFSVPSLMSVYLVFAGFVLTRLRRPAARLTMKEQQLEGHLRFVNSRLITHSEEVAFYRGGPCERNSINQALNSLAKHMQDFINFKFSMGFTDNILGKYFGTMVGYMSVSIPFLWQASVTSSSASQRLEQYYSSGRMMVKLAEAIGRLVLAGRELTRLSGYTARVTQLTDVLSDLHSGHYERTMVDQRDNRVRTGRVILADNVIRFEHVPLVTPNGDILVEELSFEVRSGTNVLVCGPNGCGKSSLFRILGELWPLFGGVLTKPKAEKLFYIPQRPYMTLGSLRDQVIYPDGKEDMAAKGLSDEDLTTYLGMVQLTYILDREGGWDAMADWMDVLSGGEKQRVAMARLFYHKPQFAILDECTSAVSVDVEDAIYRYCRQTGITLFTVSHRKSLWKHHDFYLHMDGRGSFTFKTIGEETEAFGS